MGCGVEPHCSCSLIITMPVDEKAKNDMNLWVLQLKHQNTSSVKRQQISQVESFDKGVMTAYIKKKENLCENFRE